MLQAIKNSIHKMLEILFYTDSYGSNLERYILSKRPQTVFDVEHYTIEYERRTNKGWIL